MAATVKQPTNDKIIVVRLSNGEVALVKESEIVSFFEKHK